jgi:putative PEP-CTERM system TPR-repeat lipoprotein
MTPSLRMRPAALSVLLASLILSACNDERPETLLASARDYLARNDSRAAVIQIKNALQKRPDSAEARFLLAKALLESGDAAGAELEARKALEFGYPADRMTPLLARSLLAQGKAERAIAEFSGKDPVGPEERAELHTVLGLAHASLGDIRVAEAALGKAMAAKPDHGPALLAQARVKAAARDYTGALAQVESTLEKMPGSPEAWKLKGDILGLLGQGEPALAAYRMALEVRPDFTPAHTAMVSALLDRSRVEEAGHHLEALKQKAPNDLETRYLEALVAFRKGDHKTAQELVRLLVQAVPDNPRILQLAGAVEYQRRAWRQAEAYLSKALSVAPDLPLARRLLVSAHMQSGQPGLALAALQPVMDRIGRDSEMLALAGQVHLQNGEMQKAEQYFSQASALDPEDPGKRTSLAVARIVRGQVDAGLGELERISASDKGTVADLALVTSLLERKRFDQALLAIETLEGKQPGKPLAHALRGRTLAAMGNTEGARRSFERALSLDPAHFPAAAALAGLDVRDGRPEEARKRFEAMLAVDPKNVQARLALADLRRQAGGKPEEVAALLAEAVATAPAELAPRLALVDHYLRVRDTAGAVSAAQEAAAALPDRPEVLNALGAAQQAAKDFNQALGTYGKLADLDRNSPQPYLRMADVHLAAGNREQALGSLRRALAVKPDLAEAQRRAILLHLDGGRTAEALAIARETQRQRPAMAIGYVWEGDVRAAGREWAEAAAAYRAALKHGPAPEAAMKLHAALVQQGGGEADRFAAAWLREHPKDVGFHSYMGDRATARKDYETAARHYRAVAESQPDNGVALNNLAWVAGRLKDPLALEYAEKANRLAPGQPAVMDTLAVLLLEGGETQRAVQLLKKAVELAPGAPEIRLNLAKALIRSGDRPGARKELETLSRLGERFPGQAEIAQLMRQV